VRKVLALLLSAAWILPIGINAVPANACAEGFNNNISVNVTTGEVVYFCTPAGDPNPSAYNPQLNPDAPPAETTQTREQAAAERAANAAAERAAAERAAAAAAAEAASKPVVPRVIDPLDPIPGVASGEKIPETTVSGQSDFTCPVGSGKAVEVNATTSQVSSYCVKNWISPTEQKTIDDQRVAVEEAKAEALEKSKAWNKENPGKQKCFTYSVGNESGGVCANPTTGDSTSKSETETVTSGTSNNGLSDTRTVVSESATTKEIIASGKATIKSVSPARTNIKIDFNPDAESAILVATKKGSKIKLLVENEIVDTLAIK
jgi:membrane protein involved in colicin uptake